MLKGCTKLIFFFFLREKRKKKKKKREKLPTKTRPNQNSSATHRCSAVPSYDESQSPETLDLDICVPKGTCDSWQAEAEIYPLAHRSLAPQRRFICRLSIGSDPFGGHFKQVCWQFGTQSYICLCELQVVHIRAQARVLACRTKCHRGLNNHTVQLK